MTTIATSWVAPLGDPQSAEYIRREHIREYHGPQPKQCPWVRLAQTKGLPPQDMTGHITITKDED